jgi:hypothetical protein
VISVLRGRERDYAVDASAANVQVRCEDATGLTLGELVAQLAGPAPDPSLLEPLFGSLLVDPENPTAEEIRAILDDIGGHRVVIQAVLGAAEALADGR